MERVLNPVTLAPVWVVINRLCALHGLLHFSDAADELLGHGHAVSLHSFSKAYGMDGWHRGGVARCCGSAMACC